MTTTEVPGCKKSLGDEKDSSTPEAGVAAKPPPSSKPTTPGSPTLEPVSDCCGAVEVRQECDMGFEHGGVCSACGSEDASFNVYPLPNEVNE